MNLFYSSRHAPNYNSSVEAGDFPTFPILEYAGKTMPRKPKCPGFVITAAVLLFIYGTLMLICSFCGAAEMAVLAVAPDQPNNGAGLFEQELELAKRVPSYAIVEGCEGVFNFALGVVMIVVGFGVLRLRPSARFVGSSAAAAELVKTFVYGLYTVVVVFPVNDRIIEEQMQNAPLNVANFAQTMTWAALVFQTVLAMAFCLCIIGFLNLKKSRDAFAGKFDPDPHDERLARLDDFDEDDDYGPPRSRPPRLPGDTGITGKPE